MELRRGDLVIVSAPESYGKPRPSVIVQADVFDEVGSFAVLLMTSELREDTQLIRHRVLPSASNGLIAPTAIMIDKIFSVPRERMGKRIGRLGSSEMAEVIAAFAVFLGFRREHSA